MKLPTQVLVEKANDYIYEYDRPDSALVLFSIASNRYSDNASNAEKLLYAKAFMGKWYLYFFYFFDNSKSYESINQAKDILEEIGADGEPQLPRVYLNLGCMFETLAEQSRDDSLNIRAMEYLHKSFELSCRQKDISVLSMAFSNMVYVAHVMNALDDISRDYETYCNVTHNSNNIAIEYNKAMYAGLKLVHQGLWKEALPLFQNQLTQVRGSDYLRYQIMMHNNIALCYSSGGMYGKAKEELLKSERMAFGANVQDAKLEIYRFMTDYAHNAGDKETEAEYHNKYLCLKDTLLNYNQLASINQLNFLNDIKQLDQRMLDMAHRQRTERMILVILSIVALIITAFSFRIWYQNRRLRSANRLLYEQNVAMLNSEDKERRKRREQKSQSEVSDMSPEDANLLSRIIAFMENDKEVFSSDFTVERLAQLLDEKYRNVSRLISETGAENSSQFINKYRIEEACRRINNTEQYGNLSLEAIANGVGFKSRSTFVIAFKRFTGLTPSEYQRIAKSKHNEQ